METQLAQIAKELRAIAKRELAGWLRRGDLLTQARALINDAHFKRWTRSLGISKTTVYKSMAAWRDFGNSPVAGQFKIEAMAILAQSAEARDEALLLAPKQKITAKLARELVAKHVPLTPTGAPRVSLGSVQTESRDEVIPVEGGAIIIRCSGTSTISDMLGMMMHAQRTLRDRISRAA